MPGTTPPGEAEGKGPSAYTCKQDTTTQHVTTGAGLPPVNHMSAARRDAKSCVAHGGRDPKGLPHGAGQTAGEQNGRGPDVRLPGSPQAKGLDLLVPLQGGLKLPSHAAGSGKPRGGRRVAGRATNCAGFATVTRDRYRVVPAGEPGAREAEAYGSQHRVL